MIATASGWFSRRPAARRRRDELRRGEELEPLFLPGDQAHPRMVAAGGLAHGAGTPTRASSELGVRDPRREPDRAADRPPLGDPNTRGATMKRLLTGLLALTLAAGCSAAPSAHRRRHRARGGQRRPSHRHGGGRRRTRERRSTPSASPSTAQWRPPTRRPTSSLSPASIALALSMARAGARGQTATEMDAVLRDLGTDEHAAWLAALDSALNSRTGQFPDRSGKTAGRHAPDRQRAVRPARVRAPAGLPRRPRRPLRGRPSARGLRQGRPRRRARPSTAG